MQCARCHQENGVGWLLSTKVNRAPWEAFGPANPDPLNNQALKLYNLRTDFSQTDDLATKHPEKAKQLKQMFVAEARKYQVFPPDASVAARIVAPRPNITAGRTELVYTRPMTGLPQGDPTRHSCSTRPTRSAPTSRCRRAAPKG